MWPHSTFEYTLLFCPDKAEDYVKTAYLDITGSEQRIPLKLHGAGLGPRVVLNVEEINANNLFIYTEHQYEVVLANKGVKT